MTSIDIPETKKNGEKRNWSTLSNLNKYHLYKIIKMWMSTLWVKKELEYWTTISYK